MIIVRVKAVSECMRIRRAAVTYLLFKNQNTSLLECPHPLKKFKDVAILDGFISCLDKKEYLSYDEEVFFHRYSQVDTGNGIEQEVAALGAVLLRLEENIVEEYIEKVNNHVVLDQWNGEYEYLIGLFYEYEKNNIDMAKEWYQKAVNKNFMFDLKEN